MKYCLTGLYVLFFTFISHAQATFVKAYIVNEKGDTLKGEAQINPKKELNNYNKVTFKDASGVQKIYKPAKIKAYGFNEQHFVSIESEGEKYFFNRILGGEISLYKLGFEAMRMNNVVFEEEFYLLNSETKEPVAVKHGNFKKQLADWMKDNTEIAEEYGEEKKFDLEKAIQVISNYNAWKASK